MIGKSRTKDPFLAASLRNIWLNTATHDIVITVKYIAGAKNTIVDALSRLFSHQKVDENTLVHLVKNFK